MNITKKRKKKPSIGDIVEIRTPKGIAYGQYTHWQDLYGELIRILPGLYDHRPESFSELGRSKELYFTFFPLGAAASRDMVEIVTNELVPTSAVKFPLMRIPGAITSEGKVLNWEIWNGETGWRVKELTEDQKLLSITGIWDLALLVERIVLGWRPNNDFGTVSSGDRSADQSTSPVSEASSDTETEPGDMAVFRELGRAGLDFSVPHSVLHYLYFPLKKSACLAAEELKKAGLEVDVSRAADDNGWLALASQSTHLAPESVSALRSRLEEIARNLDGEYDGWEAEVAPQH
jgi:Regulator of ribonuclease activity B